MNLQIQRFMDRCKGKGCLKHFLYIKIEVGKNSLACSLRMENMSRFQRTEAQNAYISTSYLEKIPCTRKTACISCHHFSSIKLTEKRRGLHKQQLSCTGNCREEHSFLHK